MALQTRTTEEMEKKLDILKSILDSYPFGYTLMEIYNNFKEKHKIGSRNTLKKYLGILVERGDVKWRSLGNYRIFRSKNPFTTRTLFELYPHLGRFSMNLFSAITKVLGDDISAKGKAIGKLIAQKMPMLESKAFKQFKKFKAFFEIIPFQKFLENMREKTILEFETSFDSEIKENEAFLIFRDTELLKEGAWIHYYVIAGVIEYHLNEVFFQEIDVNVDSINAHECIIKFEKRRA